jgi:DNA-binding transcriptional LysR family regulator
MELRYLRYFAKLTEEMNFNRAAERLNISQPPLSRQIKMLEEELGTSLLLRKGKKFQLTEAGRFFNEGALRILEDVALLERQTRLVGHDREAVIRIGCIGSIMFSFFPDLLAFLTKQAPESRIEIAELASEQQANAIRSGKIDVGFLRSWVESENLRFEALGEESLSIIHPLAMNAAPSAGLSFFADKPFVSGSAPGLHERIEGACERAGFAPRVAYECSQFSSILKLVAAGLGWSVIPTFALKRLAIDGVGMIVLPDTVLFGIAYREGLLPERIKIVIDGSKSFIAKNFGTRALGAGDSRP